MFAMMKKYNFKLHLIIILSNYACKQIVAISVGFFQWPLNKWNKKQWILLSPMIFCSRYVVPLNNILDIQAICNFLA